MYKVTNNTSESMITGNVLTTNVLTTETGERKAGHIHDDIANKRLLSRLECLAVGKYLTAIKQDDMVDEMRASLASTFFVGDPNLVIEVFRFLNLTTVMKMTQLCRQLNIILQENLDKFGVLETEKDWPNIRVVKLLARFPNMSKVFCRHFLTNIDFQNIFRSY